jgi:transposase-like protein
MGLRSFVMWFMPAATKAAAEVESRSWIATCPHCGASASIWDLGGIRYKASGTPSIRFKCPSCGKSGMHRVEKKV